MSRTAFFLVLLFLCACTNSEIKKVNLSPGKKEFHPNHVLVTIGGDRQFYVGNRSVDSSVIDSFLTQTINERRSLADTPAVVIHADTATLYVDVFRILKIAKRENVKVVTNVR